MPDFSVIMECGYAKSMLADRLSPCAPYVGFKCTTLSQPSKSWDCAQKACFGQVPGCCLFTNRKLMFPFIPSPSKKPFSHWLFLLPSTTSFTLAGKLCIMTITGTTFGGAKLPIRNEGWSDQCVTADRLPPCLLELFKEALWTPIPSQYANRWS